MADGAGKVLGGGGRFVVKGRLGAGGMGVVYQAWDHQRDELVALKALRELEPMALYRFKQEFRTLADISHPNLVTLHELVSLGERWFFTMELVDGGDFLSYVRGRRSGEQPGETPSPVSDSQSAEATAASALRRSRPLEAAPLDADGVARLREALAQLAAGVSAIHAAGHLHRDLKPSNVLVTPQGRLVILDFGVATETRPQGETVSGREIVGTPAYIAPEVGIGQGVREASDWYAVGVMIYEALAHRRPFSGELHGVLDAKRVVDPDRPSKLVSGVPPDLEELCMRMLARDPAARPSGAEIARHLGAGASRGSSIWSSATYSLIGRERHLDALERVFQETRGGQARVVMVHGSSGMGKSAMVGRFMTRVRGAGDAVTLAGRCYLHESVPYKALDSLIDALARHLLDLPERELAPLVPPELPALARVFPVLRRLEGVLDIPWLPNVAPDPHELRHRAVAALRELLRRVAKRAPLVLHIDDVQWGDAESAKLLAEALRVPHAPSVLLLLSYRTEDQDCPFLRALTVDALEPVQVPVHRLSLEQARALAATLLEGTRFVEVAERIGRESGGVPFFIEQMVRYVLSRGSAEVALEDAVAAQLAALPEGARSLLCTIAIAARPVPQRVVLRSTGLMAQGRSVLDQLRVAHLVRAKGLDPGDAVECYHDRIRETATSALDSAAAEDIHHRLARALIADESQDAEAIAMHLDKAGEHERAADHYLLAAENAARQLAFDSAVSHYRRALALRPLQGRAESEVLVKLADAMCSAGAGTAAVEIYGRAATDAPPDVALQCYARAVEELLRCGHIDEGVVALRRFLPHIGLELPKRPLLGLLTLRARLALRGFSFREQSATRIAPEHLTRIDTCWSAAAHLGMSHHMLGALFQARHALESLRAGDPRHLSRAFGLEAIFQALKGPRRRARAEWLLERAAELSQKSGDPLTAALVHGASAIVNFQFSDWKVTHDHATSGVRLLRDAYLGSWWQIGCLELYVMWSRYYGGNLRGMCERADEWLINARRRGNLFAEASVATGLPNLTWLVRGDLDGARRAAAHIEQAWVSDNYFLQHYWSFLSSVQNELYAGDPAAAWNHVEHHWPRMKRAFLLYIRRVRSEAGFSRGRAAIAAAAAGIRRDELLAVAERAARANPTQGTPFERTVSALQLACVAAVRGHDDKTSAALRHAIEVAEQSGMLVCGHAARARLGALLGGDQGQQLARAADEWMSGQGIVDRARWLDVMTPGFGAESG